MPSLLVRKPDDATPVRSVTKPIVIVFDPPVAGLDPEPGELGELDDPDEPHAARAVQAATTRTAHPESRRRIGDTPSTIGRLQRHAVAPFGRALKPYRKMNGNVNGMDW
jgi:hypothetical protein